MKNRNKKTCVALMAAVQDVIYCCFIFNDWNRWPCVLFGTRRWWLSNQSQSALWFELDVLLPGRLCTDSVQCAPKIQQHDQFAAWHFAALQEVVCSVWLQRSSYVVSKIKRLYSHGSMNVRRCLVCKMKTLEDGTRGEFTEVERGYSVRSASALSEFHGNLPIRYCIFWYFL